METFSALLALCEGNPSVDSLTKVSDVELWVSLWSAPEQTVEQTIETPWRSLWRHCNMAQEMLTVNQAITCVITAPILEKKCYLQNLLFETIYDNLGFQKLCPSVHLLMAWHFLVSGQAQWWPSRFLQMFGISTGKYIWWRHQMDIFHITGCLCGDFTGHRRIPLTKASDADLWCFLWSAPE